MRGFTQIHSMNQAYYQLVFYSFMLNLAFVSYGSCLACVKAGEGGAQETRTTTEQWLSGVERETRARNEILDRLMEEIHKEQAQRAGRMKVINDRLVGQSSP